MLILLLLLLLLQVMDKMLLHMDGTYNIPNLRGRGATCRTNLPSNTAFRGFGAPQALLVVESMLNDVASLLGRPTFQVVPRRILTHPREPLISDFCFSRLRSRR